MPQSRPKPKTRRKPKPIVRVEPEKKAEPEAPGYRRWLKYILAVLIMLLLILKMMEKEAETPVQEAEPPKAAGPAEQAPTEGTVPGGTGFQPVMTGKMPVPPVKKNTPPEVVSIKLNPKLVYPGTRIKAVIEGKDEDGDPVTFYREWKKNDEVLPGETLDELDTKGLKKGDWITLYVTPFDGKEKGKRKWSPTIMIANRPPEITSSPPALLSNGKYIYEVKAVDLDGDKLTFSLENAPSGMAIDHVKGRIEWKVPDTPGPDLKSVPGYVKIIVSDGDASAFQGFSLTPKIEVIPPSP